MEVNYKLLYELRRKHKMTQSELGLRINKAKETVSRFENGVKNPSLKTLCAYADVFGTTVDELLIKRCEE